MDRSLMSELQRVSQLNRDLLALSNEGQWGEFIAAMDRYEETLSEVMRLDRGTLSAHQQAAARELIATMLAGDALMVQRMRARLDRLREEMSGLNKGKAVSSAYAAPFTATIR